MIDFIGIGAAKSGTTWLYSRLSELPDIHFTPIKEIHYFSRHRLYESPSNLSSKYLVRRFLSHKWLMTALKTSYKAFTSNGLHELIWYFKYNFSNYTDQWYLSLFEKIDKFKGEITPAYTLLNDEHINDMYAICPEAKIIFIIRNPIERAWSQWKFFSSFDKTKEEIYNMPNSKVIEFINSDKQVKRSEYLKAIRRYMCVYPTDQILISFYDAIISDPKSLLESIVDFIGADKENVEIKCKFDQIVNPSYDIEMPTEIYNYLKDKYKENMWELSDVIGGYCSEWYNEVYGSQEYTISNLVPSRLLSEMILG